jgi:hypothetical protein
VLIKKEKYKKLIETTKYLIKTMRCRKLLLFPQTCQRGKPAGFAGSGAMCGGVALFVPNASRRAQGGWGKIKTEGV